MFSKILYVILTKSNYHGIERKTSFLYFFIFFPSGLIRQDSLEFRIPWNVIL